MNVANWNNPSFIFTVLLNILVINPKFSLQQAPLPTNLIPQHYLLKIYADLKFYLPEFWGIVKIRMKCTENTKQIILHSRNLVIDKEDVKLNLVNSEEAIYIEDQNYLQVDDQYLIQLNEDLISGQEYELHLPFTGQFSLDSRGFILINHYYEDRKINRLHAVTQMGPFDARGVFPCFDQIDLKAPFKIYIHHPKGFNSLSNMTQKRSRNMKHRSEWKQDIYQESVPIPPFLVTLAIVPDDYKYIQYPIASSEMLLKIWAHKSKIRRIQFTAQLLFESFNFYKDYFASYALTELNIILFHDIKTVEIGFYGSIALGESLITEEKSAMGLKEFAGALDLCRLMSRQWIGSYATMVSWNEYWLHDALAHYLSLFCVNSVPRWESGTTDFHIAEDFFSALSYDDDGLINKFPTSETASSLQSVDPYYWKKGQQLIVMLNFILGDEVFQHCVQSYLKKFEFKNSSISDVWNSFSESAIGAKHDLPEGLTIERIMNSWTEYSGYPLITVTVKYDDNTILIKQNRFKRLDERIKEIEESTEFNQESECSIIPLSYYKKGGKQSENVTVNEWLICDETTRFNIDIKKNEWILVNWNFNVLSRTNYDKNNWLLIKKTLLDPKTYLEINTIARAKLWSDISELSRAGVISYKFFFNTILYLLHEESYLPWTIIAKELETIRFLLFETDIRHLYRQYIRENILSPVFHKFRTEKYIFQFSTTDYLENNLKRIIINLACNFGDEFCVAICRNLFNEWKDSMGTIETFIIPEQIRSTVYCHAIRKGSKIEWNFLWQQYDKSNPGIENDTILEALGCSHEKDILVSYLWWSLNKDSAEPSDSFKIFRSIARNYMGYKILKEFFLWNFDTIYKFTQDVGLPIEQYFKILLDFTTLEEDKVEVMTLAHAIRRKLRNFNDILKKNFNKASRNILWIEKNGNTILEEIIQTKISTSNT